MILNVNKKTTGNTSRFFYNWKKNKIFNSKIETN